MRRILLSTALLLVGCSQVQPITHVNKNTETINSPPKLIEYISISRSPDKDIGISWDINKTKGSDLVKNIYPLTIPKDKYETESEYKHRIAKVNDIVIRGINRLGSEYSTSFYYDPDTEEMKPKNEILSSGRLQTMSYYEENNGGDSGVGQFYSVSISESTTKKNNQYIGTNAFGVSKSIENLETESYILVIGKVDDFYKMADFSYNNCKIPINEMKQYDRYIAIEYLAKLKPPYSKKTMGYFHSPTIDEPYRVKDQLYVFVGDLLAARLVNTKTNKIYDCDIQIVVRHRDWFNRKQLQPK